METKHYIVTRIDGDYAYLKDLASGEEIFLARALLPEEIDEGVKLCFEAFQYSVEYAALTQPAKLLQNNQFRGIIPLIQ